MKLLLPTIIAIFVLLASCRYNIHPPTRFGEKLQYTDHQLLLYFHKDKRTKYNDTRSSSYRINPKGTELVYNSGVTGRIKHPNTTIKVELKQQHLDSIAKWIAMADLPASYKKHLRPHFGNPLQTAYFKNKSHTIRLEWHGQNQPNHKVMHRLEKLRSQLYSIVEKGKEE